ncbi:flagellar basal-body MS-ring/collar protein FliF [Propionivibrio limicola]|uniref:flagellar basal-body MS-ring/collar protein FliF n=1 Tax=Propionivibrio limicola TaxID=167645 RepID=UPI001292A1A9|nr:flagellar basal-body MS-ring/collar protein FliF [Propionivibrio limicola]
MAAIGTETNTAAGAANPAANPATSPGTLPERLRAMLGRLTSQQKILLMVAIAAIIALIVAGSTWIKQADYRILFSNISERDGGAIITALEQLNVPYRFSESGNAILVPSPKVHEVRLRLATQGLPKAGGVGFELMENQKFGISQFAEQVNYQRGLEGELARTIQSVSAIQAARVHLAIPKPTVFVREELKPSASVLLNLYPGRALDPSQIAGIQNLVAASVPSLTTANVTIIDQSGAMLSQLKSKLMELGLDPTQLKYVQEVEAITVKRIEEILSPIVGRDNVHVQVAADIDFSQTEQTAETHRPNATPPEISIRSQQTSESVNAAATAQGVPGAISNQPPAPATAPLTQPAVPGAGAPTAAGQPIPGQLNAAGVQAPISNVGQPISSRKDSTINYELDKTIRHTKQALGAVKRLSAAVVVNHRKDAKGLVKPLGDTELKQINDLVKEAMGYSRERGDTVSVANAPFSTVDKSATEIPLWKDPEILALLKEVFRYGAIAAIIAFLMLKIVMPLIRTMMPPPPEPEPATEAAGGLGGNIDIVAGEEEERPLTPEELFAQKLGKLRELAQQDPKVVANIIKNWTGANGG